jgi:hypothetical protein
MHKRTSPPPRAKRPPKKLNTDAWQGWVRFKSLPFAEGTTRRLIDEGHIVSALVTLPGSRKGLRLIQTSSVDRYLQSIAEAQRNAKTSPLP